MVLPIGVAMALSACSSVKTVDSVISYLYRPHFGFVRIEHIEPGAPDNAHPFDISFDALGQSLASIQVEGGAKMAAAPMFNEAELKEFVPHLVAALAKAGPREDVCFAVVGQHGLFGSASPLSVTSGRLFARDGRLNIIFGLVQTPFEDNELGNALVPPFPPGSRTQVSNTGWKVLPKGGRLADGRTDWIVLDNWVVLDTTKAKAPDAGAASPATADTRYQEIESKLTVLGRLKEKGLITEEEYKERRRVILEGL